jgi:aspartate ammonia-lyase
MRIEHDFLGDVAVPDEAYYGVQTMRAMENFKITEERADSDFIVAFAKVKTAAARANMSTGRLDKKIGEALCAAADEVIAGKLHEHFTVDPIQGGAGTSFNMNMNEILSNRALELIGEQKGNYAVISPNNHSNMAQSTNDSGPTSIKVCAVYKANLLIDALQGLADALGAKSEEYKSVLKMGRTHLQDAVPITLGQEMHAYQSVVLRGVARVREAQKGLLAINMGATAVGTGLNAQPEYIKAVAKELAEITGEAFYTTDDLVDGTQSLDVFADLSAAMKTTALGLIKIANDFRLMASGPRCGLGEVKLQPRQPGSSIMPGKVNPVIPEVLDQTCYQVIGNDLALSLGVENGQFELNVMEPIVAYNLFRSLKILRNAVIIFTKYCVDVMEANVERCQAWVDGSVGIITALLPHIGYEASSMIAKQAYATGRPVRELVLESGKLTQEEIDIILSPEEMTVPGIAGEALLKAKK